MDKCVFTNEEMNLVRAMHLAGVGAEISSEVAYAIDGYEHLGVIISLDVYSGEYPVELVFHPYTGEFVESFRNCPIIEE